MDGIDGIAAAQAIFMLAAAVWLCLEASVPMNPTLWWLVALAAATVGFLALNWPPARIFMGDVGSTYLGFMIAWAALGTIGAGWMNLWQWLVLSALFVTDATLTLIRRLLRGEKIFEAHRLHAYQHLSRRWGGHLPVTVLAVAINVVWLLPLAWSAGLRPEFGPTAGLLAYASLAVVLLVAGAGAPERPARTSS
jgi:Fuc2NAc and GlcNAc transferase